jgi:hypothetical protein
MKENTYRRLSEGFSRVAMAMVAIGIAAAPAVHAKSNPKRTTGNPANVVAHVELSGGSVTRMQLVKSNGKEFLLLGFDSSLHIAVLDVSEPRRPRTVETAAGAPERPDTDLKTGTDNSTLSRASDPETTASSIPKEIRNLSGVTAFTKERAHGFIYATNGDGLWILKTNQRAKADASLINYANAS